MEEIARLKQENESKETVAQVQTTPTVVHNFREQDCAALALEDRTKSSPAALATC